MTRRRLLLPVLLLLLVPQGCQGEDRSAAPRPRLDRELRAELLAMQEQDQAERTGQAGPIDDSSRVARLKEIVAEHGWPTYDLVGKDGANAAWVVAQHADLDLEFQKEALGLLESAVADGQGSQGNLAYLRDRVLVAEGRPQQYGTQMTCAEGGPEPRTPIEDPGGLDDRRDEAGLAPYADYEAEMAEVCAAP